MPVSPRWGRGRDLEHFTPGSGQAPGPGTSCPQGEDGRRAPRAPPREVTRARKGPPRRREEAGDRLGSRASLPGSDAAEQAPRGPGRT